MIEDKCPNCGKQALSSDKEKLLTVQVICTECMAIFNIWYVRGYNACSNIFHAINPEASKLIKEEKPFVVVPIDKHYFIAVLNTIKHDKVTLGQWSAQDEITYSALVDKCVSEDY